MARRSERPVDEAALLGLMWRGSAPSPRSSLSTSAVTSLAVEIADQEGIDAVTIRRVAQEAGVTAMALYPHIGGGHELLELMLDRVAGQTYDSSGIPTADGWRTRIAAIADANWASFLRHPWTADLAPGRAVPGPGRSAKYETELRALDGIGLTDLEMDHTLTALLALVQGTARAALAAQQARDHDERSDTQWWRDLEPAFTAAIGTPRRFPTAARVAGTVGTTTGRANDAEGAHQLGVELLLDGLEQRLQSRRG